jgi:hypothetical protein
MHEEQAKAGFGTSVTHLGDLNGDGYPDIAVGAPFRDAAGAVYVLFLGKCERHGGGLLPNTCVSVCTGVAAARAALFRWRRPHTL